MNTHCTFRSEKLAQCRTSPIPLFALICLAVFCTAGTSSAQMDVDSPIDRRTLVQRHNIQWNDITGQIPLGNGEFCFNADGTGLQTVGGNIMSHWGWHSFPLPEGWTTDRVPITGTFQQGRCTGPDIFPEGTQAIRTWMFDNPHRMNLGRVRLRTREATGILSKDVSQLSRSLDLWSGKHRSSFLFRGKPVHIETCVPHDLDAVAVRIESPALANGELLAVIDFPYPALETAAWVGDFKHPDGHLTKEKSVTRHSATLMRQVDNASYYVQISWSPGAQFRASASPHEYSISGEGLHRIEFLCAFSPRDPAEKLPSVEQAFEASATGWERFWYTGGAIDLSGSTDPRWRELERRIVLSQYLMAAQAAGSFPPAETGLMGIDPWRGQFHMEMTWWHLAHYALWNRWSMAEKALGCYESFRPGARALAEQLGYKGLKWPKSVGPEGRSAPWTGNQVLLWKQPHPIFFAELEYRLRPTRDTLDKWAEIITGTAEHMADYPTLNQETGIYSLVPSMPPSEQGITQNTVFDLAYWRWGLDRAQEWRVRLGMPRNPLWDKVRERLAPLPSDDGVFVHSDEWHDTYTKRAWEHPDPVGVLGMLPPIEAVDARIAHDTVLRVWKTWDWNRCWGWDFPWMAMAAARVGEPAIAVESLLKDAGDRNRYDERGVNTGGPCPYLPGNGGLLYAVAMMAAGWDGGPAGNAPGFPAGEGWSIRAEGLTKAP